MSVVIEAANRMSSLVRDLLAYSRANSSATLHCEKVDASEALAIAIHNLQASIDESGARITHNGLPTVCADSTRLPLLFQNLIANAIKYRKRDAAPRIDIKAERQGVNYRFAVRDNGIGFKPEHAEQIFGVFKRLHGRDVPGTGIGLAICRTIVEQNSGRIWAEAQEGSGATFYFTLPAVS
jgi:two-component system, chemotaxis family, sensor kinase Cph1